MGSLATLTRLSTGDYQQPSALARAIHRTPPFHRSKCQGEIIKQPLPSWGLCRTTSGFENRITKDRDRPPGALQRRHPSSLAASFSTCFPNVLRAFLGPHPVARPTRPTTTDLAGSWPGRPTHTHPTTTPLAPSRPSSRSSNWDAATVPVAIRIPHCFWVLARCPIHAWVATTGEIVTRRLSKVRFPGPMRTSGEVPPLEIISIGWGIQNDNTASGPVLHSKKPPSSGAAARG